MAMAGGETMAAGFYAGVTADGGAEDLGFVVKAEGLG